MMSGMPRAWYRTCTGRTSCGIRQQRASSSMIRRYSQQRKQRSAAAPFVTVATNGLNRDWRTRSNESERGLPTHLHDVCLGGRRRLTGCQLPGNLCLIILIACRTACRRRTRRATRSASTSAGASRGGKHRHRQRTPSRLARRGRKVQRHGMNFTRPPWTPRKLESLAIPVTHLCEADSTNAACSPFFACIGLQALATIAALLRSNT